MQQKNLLKLLIDGRCHRLPLRQNGLKQLWIHSAIVPDLTWHHTEMTGRMRLVDFKIHQKIGHVGGMSMRIDK